MDPSLDEFAQTRPPDDLFDDDFTPVAESQLRYDPPPPAPVVQSVPPPPQQQFREPRYDGASRDLPRGVPRGPRGARGGRRGGAAAPRSPPKPAVAAPSNTEPAAEATEGAVATEEKVEESAASPTTVTSPPTGPAAGAQAKPTPSVRGDRSLTGGPAKKKLTETELNEKLAAMSLKNKALTEAHQKALADQDAFAAREKQAAERRKVERVERQAMNNEREANRQRKLKVMGGREWDAEKNEEDFRDEGRRARRGAHGGVTGTRGDVQSSGDGENVPNGHEGGHRGRGGRGRGGRGRGRGDHGHTVTPQHREKTQSVPTSADFPDLPATSTPVKSGAPSAPKDLDFPGKKKAADAPKVDVDTQSSDARPKLDKQSSFGFTPTGEKRSWADEVDASSP